MKHTSIIDVYRIFNCTHSHMYISSNGMISMNTFALKMALYKFNISETSDVRNYKIIV